MPEFIPGLRLSRLYYREAVRPILDRFAPGLAHTAALIGFGSEVIGCDTLQSRDHSWGPRLILFLPAEAFEPQRAALEDALQRNLPRRFYGYSTHFGEPDATGVRLMQPAEGRRVNPMIEIDTLQNYFEAYLGYSPAQPPDIAAWLTFAEHRLLAVTSGEVFHDDLGLGDVRRRLAYYPHDLWLYLMSAQWMKVSQEEAFVARCGDVGDELGSQLIAARLAQALMRLAFLQERRYAPYSKWFGSAFARLEAAAALKPILERVVAARSWREREGQLCRAYECMAARHNALKLTRPLPVKSSWFHNRPYLVLHAELFAGELRQAIQDERVRSLPEYVGAINQWVDSTDVLENVALCRRLRRLYEGGETGPAE